MLEDANRHYQARRALRAADFEASRALRSRTFEGDKDALEDPYDSNCQHILIEDVANQTPVACFRLMHFGSGREIASSYAAQFYDLTKLEAFGGPMLEIGRFCVDPNIHDPDVLRAAWGAITRYVDDNKVEMLFGCSSFKGLEAEPYFDAFAMLKLRHLAPQQWLPQVKAPEVFRYASRLRRKPDLKRAFSRMPPLLRSYLLMGGWVSDHAVIDRAMNTLHVFTGLEVSAIPATRKRLLRVNTLKIA